MDKTWQDPRTTLNLTYFEQVIRDPRDRGNVCALDWSAEVVSEKPWGAAGGRSWRAQLGALNHRINGDCGFFSVTTWTQLTQLTQFSSIFINFPFRRGIKKVWRLSWKATFLGWLDDCLLSWLQWFKFDPWLAGHATSILWMDLFLNGSPDTHQTKTNSWYSSTVVSHNWHDFLY